MADMLLAPALVPDGRSLPYAGQLAAGGVLPGVLPRSVVDPKAGRGRLEVPVPPGPQPPTEPPPDQPPPDPRVSHARPDQPPVEA